MPKAVPTTQDTASGSSSGRAPPVPALRPRALILTRAQGPGQPESAQSSALNGATRRLPVLSPPGSGAARDRIRHRAWGPLQQGSARGAKNPAEEGVEEAGPLVTWAGRRKWWVLRDCAGSSGRPYNSSWRRRLVGRGAVVTEQRAWRACAEPRPGLRVPPRLCTPDAAQVLSPPRPGRW